MKIHCCTCEVQVDARLAKGLQVHRTRPDQHGYLFFQCEHCGDCVRCKNGKPVGVIVSDDVHKAREHIQNLIDKFGTGSDIDLEAVRTVEQARKTYGVIQNMIKQERAVQ